MIPSRLTYSVIRVLSSRLLSVNARPLNDRASVLKAHQEKLMARGLPKKKSIPGVKNVVLVASGKGEKNLNSARAESTLSFFS